MRVASFTLGVVAFVIGAALMLPIRYVTDLTSNYPLSNVAAVVPGGLTLIAIVLMVVGLVLVVNGSRRPYSDTERAARYGAQSRYSGPSPPVPISAADHAAPDFSDDLGTVINWGAEKGTELLTGVGDKGAQLGKEALEKGEEKAKAFVKKVEVRQPSAVTSTRG